MRFLVSFNTPPPHRMIEGGVAKGNRYYFLSVNFLIRLGMGLLLSFRANEKRSYPTFDWRTRFAVMAGRSISLFRMWPKKKPTLPTTLQVSKSNRGHFISHSRSTFLDRVSLDFKCTCFATSGPLRRRFFFCKSRQRSSVTELCTEFLLRQVRRGRPSLYSGIDPQRLRTFRRRQTNQPNKQKKDTDFGESISRHKSR